MINIKYLPVLTFLFIPLSACSNQTASSAVSTDHIYGTWSCQYSIEDSDTKLSLNSEDTYIRNGRANSFGTLKIKFSPELPEFEYSINGTSTWEIKDGYLISVLNDVKIVNLSHPEADDAFNLEKLFPKNISDSSKIIELTKTKLTLKSEADNELYACKRKF